MEEKNAKSGIAERLKHAIALCASDYTPEHAKWSLKIFSKEVGIPYRTLQDYIAGARLPGADALQKFATKGIDINWVLLGNEHGDYFHPEAIKIESDAFQPEMSALPLNDNEAVDIIRAMAFDYADKTNEDVIRRSGRSLPLLALIELHETFTATITVSYLRTIEAVPHFLKKGMTRVDMLKVLETAMELSLSDAAKEVECKFDGWTTAISGYVDEDDDPHGSGHVDDQTPPESRGTPGDK